MLGRVLRQRREMILKDVKYMAPYSSTLRNIIHILFMLNCTTLAAIGHLIGKIALC